MADNELRGAMIEPREIIDDGDGVTITWADGAQNRFDAPNLRRACACAGCVNEWTGERTLRPDTVAEGLSFSSIAVVGRYALNFNFSDGHDTGIYSFKYLRELSDQKN